MKQPGGKVIWQILKNHSRLMRKLFVIKLSYLAYNCEWIRQR